MVIFGILISDLSTYNLNWRKIGQILPRMSQLKRKYRLLCPSLKSLYLTMTMSMQKKCLPCLGESQTCLICLITLIGKLLI